MAEAETALQMGARHVAEQEAHVSEQEQFIARLRREGQATDQAEGVLAERRDSARAPPLWRGPATFKPAHVLETAHSSGAHILSTHRLPAQARLRSARL